jgi:hypothetical protein
MPRRTGLAGGHHVRVVPVRAERVDPNDEFLAAKALLEARVVLHLAVEHDGAGAVAHGGDDLRRRGRRRRGGLKTFLAMSICTGCRLQAPTQPSRKALRNWSSQATTSLMSPNGP